MFCCFRCVVAISPCKVWIKCFMLIPIFLWPILMVRLFCWAFTALSTYTYLDKLLTVQNKTVMWEYCLFFTCYSAVDGAKITWKHFLLITPQNRCQMDWSLRRNSHAADRGLCILSLCSASCNKYIHLIVIHSVLLPNYIKFKCFRCTSGNMTFSGRIWMFCPGPIYFQSKWSG